VPYIDSHAHLDDERFAADLPAVLERAAAAGLSHVVTIATTSASSARCVELAARHPPLWASVGLQPNELAREPADAWDQVARLVNEKKVVAVGETGLDRHWDFTPFDRQEEFFARHLELARQRGLPVVIHCRDAEADVLRLLRQDFDRHGPVRGVMHSFTGDAATADACLALGLFLSFAGMITYKSAGPLRAVAAAVPLDRLLIETDSPYLAPAPVRGRRNEPAFLVHTAACLAEVQGVPPTVIADRTAQNARFLFGLPD
jgi:TatD DNase family protein